MPRASSDSKKALRSGFGVQEGIIKIITAVFGIFQYLKDGDPVLTFFGMRWGYVKCDNEGKPENEDDVMEKDFIVQIVGKDKETGELNWDKLRFHPGDAKSADDADPEDLLDGKDVDEYIGVEGNSMWVESANFTPFQDADWIEMCKSLEAKAWKAEINDQSFAPNYVGAVIQVHTENKKLRPGQTSDKPQTKWVVDKILVRPYEKGGKKAAAGKDAGKKDAKPTTKAKEQEPDQDETPDAPTFDAAVGEGFRAAVTKLFDNTAPANKSVVKNLGGDGVKVAEFMRAVANESMLVVVDKKKLPGSVQQQIIKAMKTPDWMEEENGGVVSIDRDEDKVVKVDL